MTPDHPAEDAREARLSEGARYHEWRGGYYCECGAEMNSGATYRAHLLTVLAPVVADMLTQREREVVASTVSERSFLVGANYGREQGRAEVVARVEAVLADHAERSNESARLYGVGLAPVVRIDTIRRALGGTADGQGT